MITLKSPLRFASLLTVSAIATMLCSASGGEYPVHDQGTIDPKQEITGVYVKGLYLHQEASYRLTDLELSFPDLARLGRNAPPAVLGLLPFLGPDSITAIEDTSDSASVALEWRPFDWLGISARYGQVEGDVDITLVEPFDTVSFDYHGHLYGFGPTFYYETEELADSGLHVFGLLSTEWGRVEFDEGGSSEIWALRPKIGLKNDDFGFWTGATWQNNTQERESDFELAPFGRTEFSSVSVDTTHWNYVVGGFVNLGEDLRLSAEVGFGERQHVGVVLAYHF